MPNTEHPAPPGDRRRYSAAAERNRDPILAVLRRHLPAAGVVLEIASGSGQHVMHFAAALSALQWQPSDPDPAARASIETWIKHAGLANVCAPLDLDVRHQPWPVTRVNAVVAINMIHISPWESTPALFDGAKQSASDDAVLVVYGPFRQSDRPTAPSNERFDAQLRAQNPAWGLRDLEAVVAIARAAGFAVDEVVDMPANNLTVVFRRGPMNSAAE